MTAPPPDDRPLADLAGLFDINGKIALVTGASDGIGALIAEGLLAAGAEVWIVARQASKLEAQAARLAPLGQVHWIAADLETADGIARVRDALDGIARLDILVHNAGRTWGARIDRFERAGFEKVLDLNLIAPFELTRALLPLLRAGASADDPARVINIASIDALRVPSHENYSYSASKAALIQLTRHMGKFLAADHISVNAIAPGFFATRMTGTVTDFSAEGGLDHVRSPLGQRIGRLEDIAGAVIYLSSLAGAWLTGITIPVSGGRGTVI